VSVKVKIALPTHVHEKHHVLFTFYHIACDVLTRTTSKKTHAIENVIGYAWFPFLIGTRLLLGLFLLSHNIVTFDKIYDI